MKMFLSVLLGVVGCYTRVRDKFCSKERELV